MSAQDENEKYNLPCPYDSSVMCVQMPGDRELDNFYCDNGCPHGPTAPDWTGDKNDKHIYLSHPIRGPLKDKATQGDMDRNREAARWLGRQLREAMKFIDVDIYVPADHEDFVGIAYKHGIISVENILRIDCMIIREKYNDLVLIYAPYGPPVEGCSIEMKCAKEYDIPVVIFENFKDAVEKLKPYVAEWAEFKGEK